MIKVILAQEMKKLGTEGQEVFVKNGYARNYLFPRCLAYEATEKNRIKLKTKKQKSQQEKIKVQQESQNLKEQLEKVSLTISVKVGDKDKMFGSVTVNDITEALAKEGFEINKKDILFDKNIKELGVYTVGVKINPEIEGSVKVWIVKE